MRDADRVETSAPEHEESHLTSEMPSHPPSTVFERDAASAAEAYEKREEPTSSAVARRIVGELAASMGEDLAAGEVCKTESSRKTLVGIFADGVLSEQSRGGSEGGSHSSAEPPASLPHHDVQSCKLDSEQGVSETKVFSASCRAQDSDQTDEGPSGWTLPPAAVAEVSPSSSKEAEPTSTARTELASTGSMPDQDRTPVMEAIDATTRETSPDGDSTESEMPHAEGSPNHFAPVPTEDVPSFESDVVGPPLAPRSLRSRPPPKPVQYREAIPPSLQSDMQDAVPSCAPAPTAPDAKEASEWAPLEASGHDAFESHLDDASPSSERESTAQDAKVSALTAPDATEVSERALIQASGCGPSETNVDVAAKTEQLCFGQTCEPRLDESTSATQMPNSVPSGLAISVEREVAAIAMRKPGGLGVWRFGIAMIVCFVAGAVVGRFTARPRSIPVATHSPGVHHEQEGKLQLPIESKGAANFPPLLNLEAPAGAKPIDAVKEAEASHRSRLDAVALGRHWASERLLSLSRLSEQIRQNPDQLRDKRLRADVLRTLTDRSMGRVILEVLAEVGTQPALDILYESWTGSKERNETTQIAEALLLAKDVRSGASDALALALALREKPTSCEEVNRLVKLAMVAGDRRSVMLLVNTGARENCGTNGSTKCVKCLEEPKDLAKAIRAASARPDPLQ